MNFNRPRCKVEILSASGVLRVIITPQISGLIILDAAIGIAIAVMGWKQWPVLFHENPVSFILGLTGLLGALWYQLGGSEEIEVDTQQLIIRKNRPGWPRSWEYSVRECSLLEIREDSRDNSDRFQINAGSTTITFGRHLSSKQADDIISELQRALPDTARHLLAGTDPFGKHFTTLKLS